MLSHFSEPNVIPVPRLCNLNAVSLRGVLGVAVLPEVSVVAHPESRKALSLHLGHDLRGKPLRFGLTDHCVGGIRRLGDFGIRFDERDDLICLIRMVRSLRYKDHTVSE